MPLGNALCAAASHLAQGLLDQPSLRVFSWLFFLLWLSRVSPARVAGLLLPGKCSLTAHTMLCSKDWGEQRAMSSAHRSHLAPALNGDHHGTPRRPSLRKLSLCGANISRLQFVSEYPE